MVEAALSASHAVEAMVTGLSYLQLGLDSTLVAAALRGRPSLVTVVHEGPTLETVRALLQHGGGFALFRCLSEHPLYCDVKEHDVVLWCGGATYVEAYRAVVRASRVAKKGVIVTMWTKHEVRQGAMDAVRDLGREVELDERILTDEDDSDAWRGGLGALWWR